MTNENDGGKGGMGEREREKHRQKEKLVAENRLDELRTDGGSGKKKQAGRSRTGAHVGFDRHRQRYQHLACTQLISELPN